MSIGVGLLGAGAVAELHQRALAANPSARLVGLYDADRGHAAGRAAAWSCRTFGSREDLLASDEVDAVLVLTPGRAHEPDTLAALEAGKHVLVEKPVGAPGAVRRMLAAAAERSLVCLPGHNYAYQPEFVAARRLVRDGSLGRVRASWITYAIEHTEQVAARYPGVLESIMIHHSYLTLALHGAPTRVHVGRLKPIWSAHPEPDQAWMVWDYAGEHSVHLFASMALADETSSPWSFVVKVLGTEGGATYSWRDQVYRRPLGTLPFALPIYENTYAHEQEAFFAAVSGEVDAVVSPLEHALLAQQILERAREAEASGAPAFDLSEDPHA